MTEGACEATIRAIPWDGLDRPWSTGTMEFLWGGGGKWRQVESNKGQ